MIAVGGGGDAVNGLLRSVPLNNLGDIATTGQPTGWNATTTTGSPVTVYAICAAASPGIPSI
jgi:hypothetical protein